MQLLKSEADDIITYGGKVNRACEEFEFQNLKIDHFKCLIFVCGLKAPRYADIRARLLSRIEGETADAPVTIQTLIAEFQRLVNIKSDTTMNEHPSSSKNSVHSISEKKPGNQHRPLKTESKSTPRTPCWQCGQMHYVRYCSCIKKSSSDSSTQPREKKQFQKKASPRSQAKGIFVKHIANSNRKRKYVTININGVMTSLQLDSASDITVISKKTWQQLRRPKLTPSSIEASNASGEPLALIGEFHCEAVLNDMVKRGQCFVTSSPDLNVMGIDWIDMFNLWSFPFDTLCWAQPTDTNEHDFSCWLTANEIDGQTDCWPLPTMNTNYASLTHCQRQAMERIAAPGTEWALVLLVKPLTTRYRKF
ncbi:uncharacterized protein K02A2.6-like [Ochlerotatus camptorhynchus]|uniref:uncharacterized protein K02A2.6-like n=1 Tax=Ochlerotatus camptorhynchus TaxID=644619 RepID=UPI0031D10FCA